MKSFQERWGVRLTGQEHFRRLKNRLSNLIDAVGENVSEGEAIQFSNIIGESRASVAIKDRYTGKWRLSLSTLINRASSDYEVAQIIEAAIRAIERYGQDFVCDAIQVILNSCEATFQLIKTKDGWLVYPRGEEMLDESVKSVLGFVDGKVLEEFSSCLEKYSSNDWVGSAEKSRRTLEEALREKLGRPRLGLDAAIKAFGERLKMNNIDEHLRNLIINQLRLFDKHFNDSSKHASNTIDHEAEFIIYSTAAILKLIYGLSVESTKK